MFSDYVRLAVQGKRHPLNSECYQIRWIPLVLERAPSLLSRSRISDRSSPKSERLLCQLDVVSGRILGYAVEE